MEPPEALPQPTFLASSEGACEVLLVRHARSQDMPPGVNARDPDLHPDAAAQLTAVADRLSRAHIDAVYASTLRRAYLTAEAIAAPHGLTVTQYDELREVQAGEWAERGEFRWRAATNDPEWVTWSQTRRWDGLPGGEGDDALRARMRSRVDELAGRHLGGRIVIVSHNAAINAYLADVLGTHDSIWLVVENTSITIVRVGPEGHSLVVAGDCNHLYDPALGSSSPRH
jgi:probable phosphoglycerate mutase